MSRLRFLFSGTVFLAAFLLFLVEPIAAKQLLPVLGGSAAVWITCLVFFQTALLAGYLYAHWLARQTPTILVLLPFGLAVGSAIVWMSSDIGAISGADHPICTVFRLLGAFIGLPFVALSATSPLLQAWWAQIVTGPVPYRLYALSNLASLLALGLYPVLIEPNLSLHAQRIAWSVAFFAFVFLFAVLARAVQSKAVDRRDAEHSDEPASPLRHKLLWLLLPMGAAMQLSAVTSYLTANVAAIPLLWILPLATYLLTLIFAFQVPRFAGRELVSRFVLVLLAGLAYMLTQTDASLPMRISIGFFLAELFFACFFVHSEATALRPARASEATMFYLLFAAGGALGSFLVGIVFPLVFRFNFDLAITFLATALLALAATWRSGWNQRLIWLSSCVMLTVLFIWLQIASHRQTLVAVRNFYASLRVKQDYSLPGATVRTLSNGTIQHGTQIFGTDELRHTPTTYYAQDSGVGLALRSCCAGRARNVGVIGLGAGTLAAYGRPGDRFTFYEINPAVAPIARNVFTYMRESGAQIDVVEGDARTSLARSAPQNFDVLVVDAFSGDAIPLHLLTTQALSLYRRHLTPGGILAFHISNQHVDLEPPIALLAASAGMETRHVHSITNDKIGEFTATWMLLTDNAGFFLRPELAAHAFGPDGRAGGRVWTDDYSALLPFIRW